MEFLVIVVKNIEIVIVIVEEEEEEEEEEEPSETVAGNLAVKVGASVTGVVVVISAFVPGI
jgi:hypothetical protein